MIGIEYACLLTGTGIGKAPDGDKWSSKGSQETLGRGSLFLSLKMRTVELSFFKSMRLTTSFLSLKMRTAGIMSNINLR